MTGSANQGVAAATSFMPRTGCASSPVASHTSTIERNVCEASCAHLDVGIVLGDLLRKGLHLFFPSRQLHDTKARASRPAPSAARFVGRTTRHIQQMLLLYVSSGRERCSTRATCEIHICSMCISPHEWHGDKHSDLDWLIHRLVD